MLNCKAASRLVSEGQERYLSLWERLNLRLHLWMCVNCRRFEQQIIYLRKALPKLWADADITGGQQLSPEARERIRRVVNDYSSGTRE